MVPLPQLVIMFNDITLWKNVVMIYANSGYVCGLKSDDTFLVADKKSGSLQGTEEQITQKLKELQEEEQRRQREIQRKQEEERKCLAEEQRKRAEEQRCLDEQRRAEEQSNRWGDQGLCRSCGGQIGGIFTKKCKVCGKPW